MSWKILRGSGPVVAAAIHAGHRVRPELMAHMVLDEEGRLREEDPYTDSFAEVVEPRVVVDTSRFEVDMNRALQQSVYLEEKDAWGLRVWRDALPEEELLASRAKWLQFYAEVGNFLDDVYNVYGRFVVLDIHSYCHRRGGPDALPEDPWRNPEIIVGSSNLDRGHWASLVDRFIKDLRQPEGVERYYDVRENVRFTGGHFSRWINQRYAGAGCSLAVEFKKTFMNEWSGELFEPELVMLREALASTLPGLHEEIRRMNDCEHGIFPRAKEQGRG